MNKAKKELKDAGIQAWKNERARTDKLKEIYTKGDLPSLELLCPIREPDKNPTVVEQARLLEDFYPELVQQIKELEARQELPAQLDLYANDNNDDVVINTIAVIYKKDEVVDLIDSSPPCLNTQIPLMLSLLTQFDKMQILQLFNIYPLINYFVT